MPVSTVQASALLSGQELPKLLDSQWTIQQKHTDMIFPIPLSRRIKLLIRVRQLWQLSVESCTSYQKSLDGSQFSTLHAAERAWLHGIGPGRRGIIRLGYQLGSWIQLLRVGSPAESWILYCRSLLGYSGHLMGVIAGVLSLAFFSVLLWIW